MAVAFRTSTEAHATNGSLVITVPATVQAGDLLLIAAGLNNGGNAGYNWSTPAGWTKRDDESVGSNLYAALYVKVAVSGDAGATVTLASSTTGKSAAVIAAYSGTDQSSPIDVATGRPETTVTTSHATPTVNTTTDDDVIIIAGVQTDTETMSWSTTSGYTKRQDSLDNVNLGGHVSVTLQDKGPIDVGTYGGENLVAAVAAGKAVTWTVGLSPQQTTQTARPVADVEVTNAVGVPTPGDGSGVYADLAADDDSHYAEISNGGVVEVAFSALIDPMSSEDHTITYRACYAGGATSGSQAVSLMQGDTEIASWTDTLTGSFSAFSRTLTDDDADAITDYDGLSVRFTMTVA